MLLKFDHMMPKLLLLYESFVLMAGKPTMTRKSTDLRWFLFEDFIDICEDLELNVYNTQVDYIHRQLHAYKKYPKLLNIIFREFYPLFSSVLFKSKKGPKIMLHHELNIYDSIVNKTSERKEIVLGLNSNFLKNIITKKITYFPVFDVYKDLFSGLINNDNEKLAESLDNLTSSLKRINPDVIVINSDSTPVGRLLLLSASELGIPTVEIQHGAYKANSVIPTGIHTDYVFVWGEYFKNLYVHGKIRDGADIRILGYPYGIKSNVKMNNGKPKVVCFLGQNFEEFNNELLEVKRDSLNYLNSLCNELNFHFIYRPHPGDNLELLKSELPDVEFASKNETLKNTFDRGDIFISFNSTSLVEAALNSKICIQLKNYPLKAENFEELGICRSVDNLSEIADYLKYISIQKDFSKFHKEVDSNYIEIPSPDPGTRFLELIDDILV